MWVSVSVITHVAPLPAPVSGWVSGGPTAQHVDQAAQAAEVAVGIGAVHAPDIPTQPTPHGFSSIVERLCSLVDRHVDRAAPGPLVEDHVQWRQVGARVASRHHGDADHLVARSGAGIRHRIEALLRLVGEIGFRERARQRPGQRRVAHEGGAVPGEHHEHARVVLGRLGEQYDFAPQEPRERVSQLSGRAHRVADVALRHPRGNEYHPVISHEVPAVKGQGASSCCPPSWHGLREVEGDPVVALARLPDARPRLSAGRKQQCRPTGTPRRHRQPAVTRRTGHRVPDVDWFELAAHGPNAGAKVIERLLGWTDNVDNCLLRELAQELAVGRFNDACRLRHVVDNQLLDCAVAIGKDRAVVRRRRTFITKHDHCCSCQAHRYACADSPVAHGSYCLDWIFGTLPVDSSGFTCKGVVGVTRTIFPPD